MRIRSVMALPLAVTAAAALAVPMTAHAATATSSAGTGKARADASVSSALQPSSTALATLITGDRVRLVTTPSGATTPEILPAASSGIGRDLTTRRLGNDTYVIPAVAEKYLGRNLDPALFDVTAQSAAAGTSGRLGVALHYTGSKAPTVPGVTITSASGGKASGYLTATSAPAFGRALTAQFKADAKAGFPARSTLFTGSTVTSIASTVTPAGASPKFPMYTLIVKATDLSGKPVTSGFGAIVNVDDARKYNYFFDIEGGEARISVPAGNYSAVTDQFDYNDSTEVATFHMATVNQYKVSGANQTLTIALKGEYTQAGAVSAPKVGTILAASATWTRLDAAGEGGTSWGYSLDSTDLLYVEPQAKPTVGTVSFTESWQGAGKGSTYESVKGSTTDLAAGWDHIPSSLKATFTSSDLSTVNSHYYSDGRKLTSAFGRFALFAGNGGGGYLLPFSTPVTRTEYVGAIGTGTVSWLESYLVDNDSFDDPGFIDSVPRTIARGSVSSISWNQGPLGAAVPVQPASSDWGAYCYACSTSTQLELDQAPWVDSNPTHTGELFGDETGKPVTHFQLYRNGKLIDDKSDYYGDIVTVPAGSATYQGTLYVDRRLQKPRQSTKSTTTIGFKATPGQGPGLPSADWYCLAEDATTCHVLPVLQARAILPTSLSGTLPAARTTFTVVAHRIQGATDSTVTSATFSIRLSGTSTWKKVPLADDGTGSFAGTLDNTKYAGKSFDLQVTAADAGGSTYSQTVLKAYTVAGA